MDQAVPVDAARGPGPDAASPAGARRALLSSGKPPAGTKQAQHFEGYPMVGTFFSSESELGGKVTSCTGSVVHSNGRDLVLTAGHCATYMVGQHRIFVPQYRHGTPAAQQPHGIFPLTELYIDPRYVRNTKAPVSDLDFAFARVAPARKGNIEDVTGALTFAPSTSFKHSVRVVGYPSDDSVNKNHQAVFCDVATSRLPHFRQMQMTCAGFYGGVSGGPWIEGYDAAKRTGKLVGSTGGYYGGGNDDNDHWVTYSPLYGKDAVALYDDANAHRKPAARPPYVPAPDSAVLPGAADTWQHAKLMASGDFSGTGHSDLIVVWTDGEVTLYPGNGNGGYGNERRLLGSNDTWTHATTVTAGDFTGSRQFDLMTGWSDGEVTLYGDVGSRGLANDGTQMAAKDSTWKYAAQITAGRFNAAEYVTDLMVRWADGELTLYTGVSSGTFGQEHQLKARNETWEHATLLAAGEFSGSSKWDLMVRWSDGELDTYTGTTPQALGAETRIHNGNDLWPHDTVLTAGNFTGNGRSDDLVVRWSDGETTMYKDTRLSELGSEVMLVAPPN
ncbi:hypothetical protein OEIGOIKO_00137 [Streptomyces chrestomyceticus JCM 4735]|uniref:Peptidase S1 domain-containing protein n=2 Tax=Streptomyces chrestomyceticus TaxID=68185 RepID=A0A7U9PXR4_9ACTN|nr:hypothetical protein OEIGOIKO_00137 [Streptomyces chrestomyceticus JCM 4735]